MGASTHTHARTSTRSPRTRNGWFAIGDDDVVVNFVGPPLPSRFARLGAAGWWLGKPFDALSLGARALWGGS